MKKSILATIAAYAVSTVLPEPLGRAVRGQVRGHNWRMAEKRHRELKEIEQREKYLSNTRKPESSKLATIPDEKLLTHVTQETMKQVKRYQIRVTEGALDIPCSINPLRNQKTIIDSVTINSPAIINVIYYGWNTARNVPMLKVTSLERGSSAKINKRRMLTPGAFIYTKTNIYEV